MRKLRGHARWFIACALLLFARSFSAGAAELTVFAAASLSDALKEISADYQKINRDRVYFNFAGSSTLARQIQEGARADIFFSADEEKMDQLEGRALIRKETRRSLISNSLVIVVAPDSSLKMPGDLRKARRIALAEPNSVPAGIYGRKYLEQAGLWLELKDRVVPTENVRAALAAVESGNADAAIIYKTDAAISKKVKVAYGVPLNVGPKISYSIALLKEAPEPRAAENFLRHLQTPAAAKVFEKSGFIVLPATAGHNGNG